MKRVVIVLLLLIAASAARAQDDECGNGLPCGPLPWPVPVLPDLASPSPMPTISITATDIPPTSNPSPPTSTPTPTPAGDIPSLEIAVTAAVDLAERTPDTIIGLDGMGFDIMEIASADTGLFFSYVRGFSTLTFGVFTPLVLLLITFLVVTLVIYAITFFWPIIATVIGLIRRAVQLVLEFIPF